MYIDNINKKIKKYFNVLESDFPEFLNNYIETPELLKQQYISVTCGTIYSDLFESNFFYSSLDHSIAVALIVWHFTHNKKQTLAGLFHDVATPCFKHSIDFLNGDYMKQESTEELTTDIIKNSKEIMSLLKKDNIKIEEIDNYHIYPIADNDTPKLSADRLEYSLSNGLFMYNKLTLTEVKEIYEDIEIEINEKNVQELGFKSNTIARKFVKLTSNLSIIYREERTRYSMQLIADIIKKLNEEGKIKRKDLYNLKEQDIINIINNSKYKEVFKKWRKAKKIKISSTKPNNVYYVHHEAKIRYIDPLCRGIRISKISKLAKRYINNNLSYDMNKYIYLDFKI